MKRTDPLSRSFDTRALAAPESADLSGLRVAYSDDLGFAHAHVRQQVYLHLLETREDVIQWVRGTLLTAYERRLSPESYEQFSRRYRERLFEHLEDRRPFPFPFKRTLIRKSLNRRIFSFNFERGSGLGRERKSIDLMMPI